MKGYFRYRAEFEIQDFDKFLEGYNQWVDIVEDVEEEIQNISFNHHQIVSSNFQWGKFTAYGFHNTRFSRKVLMKISGELRDGKLIVEMSPGGWYWWSLLSFIVSVLFISVGLRMIFKHESSIGYLFVCLALIGFLQDYLIVKDYNVLRNSVLEKFATIT
jgi:hypothetical protein